MVDTKLYRDMISIDLYNIAMNTKDSDIKRYIITLLYERGEHHSVYSIALNAA